MSNKSSKAAQNQAIAIDEGKKKALDAAIEQIRKSFGKGSILEMKNMPSEVPVISTGSIGIDTILGRGVPLGRIIEIYGHESSGKTTLALHIIAAVQKTGGKALLIDAEHAFDPKYAKNLGINVQELLVSQPDYAEQALEISDHLVRSGAIDLIVVDSVAALVPREEIEADMEKQQMGLQARLMSKALRKLTGNVSRTKCIIIFINQLRAKIAQGYGASYGPTETTTGGNALKFYASVRIEVRKVQTIKKGEEETGTMTRFKVVKNKVSPPFKSVILEIVFGEGISKESELIDLGVKYGLIDKAGSWYSFDGARIGQGKDSVRDFLKKDPAISAKLEADLRAKISQLSDDDLMSLSDNDDVVVTDE